MYSPFIQVFRSESVRQYQTISEQDWAINTTHVFVLYIFLRIELYRATRIIILPMPVLN